MNRATILQQLMDQMMATAHAMKSGIRITLPDQTRDLSLTEMSLLLHLLRAKVGLTVKELADLTNVTSSAITQTTDRLIEKGLIEREQNPEDRRSVRITLREPVRQSFTVLKQQYKRQCQPLFDDLTDQEIQQLIALLGKIKGNTPPFALR